MRNSIVIFVVLIGLAACTPTANSPMISPAHTSTSSPIKTITTTNEPIPTSTPTSTPGPASVQDMSMTKGEIVDFMVGYIVKNEIEAMIDIIEKENIPLIEEPPAQFIVVFSPISASTGEDHSRLMNALETKNAEQVWIYTDGALVSQTDTQAAIRDYQQFIGSAPRNPSIFMWGYNEFGIVSIADDGQSAEVYLAASCGSACGHGLVLVLARNKDGQWEIEDMKPIWGS
jgi:hypothetical protein